MAWPLLLKQNVLAALINIRYDDQACGEENGVYAIILSSFYVASQSYVKSGLKL